MASNGPIRRFEVIVTDMTSPSAETPAGTTMRANMEELRRLNCTDQHLPRQNVSALDIPERDKLSCVHPELQGRPLWAVDIPDD